DTHAGSPIIYVHNKVFVQDRALAFVGSANMNGRSLRWDTEVGVTLTDRGHVAVLRKAVHRHWWRKNLTEAWAEPAKMQPLWQAEIRRNDVRRPEARVGFLVSHGTDVHDSDGVSLPLVTDEMV
ncbi:MAG: phospholipase D-like domain-containing protein, partial [Pseudomonadota bacterium]